MRMMVIIMMMMLIIMVVVVVLMVVMMMNMIIKMNKCPNEFMASCFPVVGLGHVDADAGAKERPRVHHS